MAGGVMNQSFTCEGNTHVTTGSDVLRCIIIIIIMLLIIGGNVMCLVVFNSARSKKQFSNRMRLMMNSLCCTDLSIGALMCPSTIYPAIAHCWPFGETFCKIEALLISALFHESTLNMVLIAIDRYCIVHVSRYNQIMTSRRFLFVIVGSWVTVFMTYSIVIFAGEQFYFDEIGINCEPFYENRTVTLTVISIFYFLPAVIFMFCYGSIYRTATRRKCLTVSNDDKHGRMINANIRTSKYLAAITIGFFCAVSPWTLCTLIIVAAKTSIPESLDYGVTWLALSNSFWNCLIYGVMNRKFRRAAARFACGRWIASLQEISSHKQSEDCSYSKDISNEKSVPLTYGGRISKKLSNLGRVFSSKNNHVSSRDNTPTTSRLETPVPSPSHSPSHSPRVSHKQQMKCYTFKPDNRISDTKF